MTWKEPPYHIGDWRAAVSAKREELSNSIPSSYLLPSPLAKAAYNNLLLPSDPTILTSGILTDLDIEITSITDVPLLASRIAERKYSAVQVTEAFCKRTAIAQQCTGCLTEFMVESALERAKELDEYLDREGRTMGVLHGIPVSLKDCYNIKDIPTSSGLVSWLPYRAPKHSAVAVALLKAGAILYAKTSTSQALLMVESINNIFGTVRNPYNLELSVGGSSGGEAALLAANGSILGSGTDGGGSLRFPAAHCGLWALKPSKERIPGAGVSVPRSGSESVNAGLGPFSKSVAGLELWMQAQMLAEPWNRYTGCIPMQWKEEEARKVLGPKLRVGIIWDDGIVKPTPPVTRALRMSVDAMKRAGHEMINLPPEKIFPLHRQAYACTMLSNIQDGGRCVLSHISASGEPTVPRTATGSPDYALTAAEIFDNHLLRSRLAGEYNELWQEYELDAILAPAVAHPANPHGDYISNSYATVYNMLDYVAGSVPVTVVDEKLDVADMDWYEGEVYPRIEEIRFPYDRGDREMKQLYTSPTVFKGSPVGVQVLCKRLREEKCIGILKEIEALLKEQETF